MASRETDLLRQGRHHSDDDRVMKQFVSQSSIGQRLVDEHMSAISDIGRLKSQADQLTRSVQTFKL